MAKTFLITLDPTTSPGPFNIYYNTISDSNKVAASPSNADKASLLIGVNVVVSDDVNNIYLENLANGCGNMELVNVVPPTTTTTSTTSTTTTTTSTTTLPPTTTTTTETPTTTTTTAEPTTTTTTTAEPTTTTTTSTSTTTTTTLAPVPYQYGLYGYASSNADACGQMGDYVSLGSPQLQVFATSPTPDGVTLFYNEMSLTTTYVNGTIPNNYLVLYSLASDPTNFYVGTYNNSTGAISGQTDCTP